LVEVGEGDDERKSTGESTAEGKSKGTGTGSITAALGSWYCRWRGFLPPINLPRIVDKAHAAVHQNHDSTKDDSTKDDSTKELTFIRREERYQALTLGKPVLVHKDHGRDHSPTLEGD
jgi:hypothetical protein